LKFRFSPPSVFLAFTLVLTFCVYLPGLHGGFFFDDEPNIVDNTEVHVSTLDIRDWRAAAQASPSAELRRPLAMLSFALNYYFTALNPSPMKLTNLAIHLLNGVLLWRVLAEIFSMWRLGRSAGPSEQDGRLIAAGIASLWLLLPINLSCVLYVVQRMESMAQTFVLAGLWLYLVGRGRMFMGRERSGLLLCAAGLGAGASLGLLCKESAVLLPLYAFLTEIVLLRFESRTVAGRRSLWAIYMLLLFLPAAFGLAWLLPHTLPDAAYMGRPFTLAQRLLTECRVLVDYVAWTLFPHPSTLSFYHDDIPLSRGWLTPPSTLACGALLVILIAAALGLRRRLPLFSLGIGWFFAAHLLTATVIPLELVFEHRNYFSSVGLLLAASALILLIPTEFRVLRGAVPLLALAAYSAETWLRAEEWRDPIQFAYSEALKHPQSARANYELGRTLTVASGYRPDSKLVAPAMAAFERAAQLPDSGAAPAAALIFVAGHTHRKVQPEWWTQLIRRLAAQPPSAESISALESLTRCQHQGECPPDTQSLTLAFLAAMDHPQPSARLLAIYGVFAANELGDYRLAEQLFNDALAQMPDTDGVRLDLAKVLILEGKYDAARNLLEQLRANSPSNLDVHRIDALESNMDSLPAGPSSPGVH